MLEYAENDLGTTVITHRLLNYLLESTNTPRLQDKGVARKDMTSTEAVGSGSRVGDATGIEA